MSEPGPHRVGYCTNVHAGVTFEQARANLEEHAVAVRKRVAPDAALGVGLWLPRPAARALRETNGVRAFASWLRDRGLDVFTFNGFPYGDFHDEVVKHRVYQPDWSQKARLDYTVDLAHILAGLLPEDGEGGISTVPIGWRIEHRAHELCARAAGNLLEAARVCARLEGETGRVLHVDVEPEPGCMLDRASDVVEFFERYLLGRGDDELVQRHLRVCHDVCHAAVMFEDQAEVLAAYDEAGLAVGKVQISSAVRARFDALDDDARPHALDALRRFREERYLHQTMVRSRSGDETFFEDLPRAIAAGGETPRGEWRVHFHVPIDVESLGELETTQDEIVRCLELIRDREDARDLEVETYAWDVLPEEHRPGTLDESIARELAWLQERLA